ncbi:MAG: hypothetical protein LAT80_12040 [Balneolaceae bacterium]|nr:hypothetical protein [Balneolaceae bacterium]
METVNSANYKGTKMEYEKSMTERSKAKAVMFYKKLQVFLALTVPILVLGTYYIEDPFIKMVSLFSIILFFFPLAVFVFVKIHKNSSSEKTNMTYQFLALAVFLLIFAYGLFFM